MTAKKLIFLGFAIFSICLFSNLVTAQSDTKQKKTPEEIASKVADKMKEKLSLSDEQYKQVYELVYGKAQSRISNKEQYKSMDKETKKQMKKQNRDEFRKQLESILTPDQVQKLSQMREKHKQKSDKESRKSKQ